MSKERTTQNGLAQLIATRIAIQQLIPEHNTLDLIEKEVFPLARKELMWASIGKFEKPDMICDVKEDLKHFSLTFTFHEVNTPEAEKQREETRKWTEQFEKRLASYKEKHPEVKFPIKIGDPLPPEFPKPGLFEEL